MTDPIVFYAGHDHERDAYVGALTRAASAAGLAIDLRADAADPASVDYLIFEKGGPVEDFAPFSNLKAILNLWAGVEGVVTIPSLPRDVPLVRMVERGLTWGMTDYVVGHVMRHHMGLDRYVLNARPLTWFDADRPLPDGRTLGVLGLGRLGRDAAEMLARLRFKVLGWSRSPKQAEGVICVHGDEGLRQVLAESEILVILLPLTAETQNLLDAERLALLPHGAVIINAGRGPILNDSAFLDALETGALSHATLDVFDREPLPEDHPFLSHPKITVTPHIASATRPETAAEAIIEQIARAERGDPLENVVDRALGY